MSCSPPAKEQVRSFLNENMPPMGIYETMYEHKRVFGAFMGSPGTHPWSQGFPLTTRLDKFDGLVLSCLAISCRVLPCLNLFVLCYLVMSRSVSCLVVSCRVLACLVLSCLVLSCLVLSRRVVSWRVLSCLVLSCLVLSCRVLSCLVLFLSCLDSCLDSCLVLSCSSLGPPLPSSVEVTWEDRFYPKAWGHPLLRQAII
jgi:hypothetical protein